MVSDPIGDMIIQIKNAGMAGKNTVVLPFSKEKGVSLNNMVSYIYLWYHTNNRYYTKIFKGIDIFLKNVRKFIEQAKKRIRN